MSLFLAAAGHAKRASAIPSLFRALVESGWCGAALFFYQPPLGRASLFPPAALYPGRRFLSAAEFLLGFFSRRVRSDMMSKFGASLEIESP